MLSGLAYENRCPDGLHFNRKNKVCDWPDNVACNLPKLNRNFLPYSGLPLSYKAPQSKKFKLNLGMIF